MKGLLPYKSPTKLKLHLKRDVIEYSEDCEKSQSRTQWINDLCVARVIRLSAQSSAPTLLFLSNFTNCAARIRPVIYVKSTHLFQK